MGRSGTTGAWTSLVVVAASLVAVTSPAGPASAAACDLSWDGAGDGSSWTDNNNWGGAGQPGNGDVVCIQVKSHTVVDSGNFGVESTQLSNAGEIEVKPGTSLLASGPDVTVWAPGTNVALFTAQGGGLGTTRAQGTVYLAAGSSLGSVLGAGAQPPANPGTMIVEGRAEVFSQGATLSSGYKMNVAPGGNLVLDPGTFMVADRGTSTTIQAGGVMSLTGDGGYYPGAAVAGQPASALVNNGVAT